MQKKISRSASEMILNRPAFKAAYVGISIFDPSENKYIYNYNADKYFVPASNTKIPTCYAAMKYLGDSLPAARIFENDTAILITPTADPSLLHPGFSVHPLINYLNAQKKHVYITDNNWKEEALGSGWSWNDYQETYMVERSPFPVFGNLITWVQEVDDIAKPPYIYSIPEVDWQVDFSSVEGNKTFSVSRPIGTNNYILNEGTEKKKEVQLPFQTRTLLSSIDLLRDTVQSPVNRLDVNALLYRVSLPLSKSRLLRSQPTDSLLKPMMHRSDNFFAEQSLLMVSNERLGLMNDERIIDTILKTDLKDLPQRPRWADGSGLSRYNLFTPQDFVYILDKMKNEFGMDRLKIIFATGGEGTITNYYKSEAGYIYGKTGTLSGVVAFSGYLYTKKGKLLVFSTLVNNHQSSVVEIRKSIEKFLTSIRASF